MTRSRSKRCGPRRWPLPNIAIVRATLVCLMTLGPVAKSSGAESAAPPRDEPTVGFPARIDQVVLPGPELEVVPLARESPIVLRIVERFAHGTGFRYDLEYYGLAAGTFDLRDYLRRKDGSDASQLPSIPVTIRSILPPGQVVPHALEPRGGTWTLTYRWQLGLFGAFWLLGLGCLLAIGVRRRRFAAGRPVTPRSVADRLRSLLERAASGEPFTVREQAELERLLVTFWRDRLGLVDGTTAAEAMRALRAHSEAGEFLRQVERWLHQPGQTDPGFTAPIDVERWLAAYSDDPSLATPPDEAGIPLNDSSNTARGGTA